jgi:CPA1 family monovalent cation:H+ antiporter
MLVLFSALAGLIALSRVSRIPYPVLLVIGGVALGFIPNAPSVELSPDVVLLVFLPPLLFYAAFVYQARQFKENIVSISLLAIGLVVWTTLGVAVVAHALAGLSWGAAFVLGAALSPTDPVAVTAIATRLGAPRRVVAVLEGESLVNDGTALVVYATAVEAVVFDDFSLGWTLLEFPVTVAGGIAVGLIVAWLVSWLLLRRLGRGYHSIVLVLFCAYLTYLSAELLHASGVLAAVSGGIYIGRRAPLDASPTDRITTYSFLEVMVFLINAIVFILLGLQFPGILAGISDVPTLTLALGTSAISLAVIVLRVVWTMATGQVIFRLVPHLRERYPRPPWRQSLVISWGGMRGAVSLAAALAIPASSAGGVPFPDRDLILFLVSSAIVVTIVLPGLTLPALVRALGLSDAADEGEAEIRTARTLGARAAIERIDQLRNEDWLPLDTAELLRDLYDHRRRGLAADDEYAGRYHEERYDALVRLRRELLLAEREALFRLHETGEISDEAMRSVERDLDLQESRFED